MSRAYGALCLFILKDGRLHVLFDKRGPDPAIPFAEALPDQDIDLAFVCRRLSQGLLGDFDYEVVPVHTFSGQRIPDEIKALNSGWPVLQLFMGIGRASNLSDDAIRNHFVPVNPALNILGFTSSLLLQLCLSKLSEMAGKSKYPAMLLRPEFTLTEMHVAYQVVSGVKICKATFKRRVLEQCIVTEVEPRKGSVRSNEKIYRLMGARYDFYHDVVFA